MDVPFAWESFEHTLRHTVPSPIYDALHDAFEELGTKIDPESYETALIVVEKALFPHIYPEQKP